MKDDAVVITFLSQQAKILGSFRRVLLKQRDITALGSRELRRMRRRLDARLGREELEHGAARVDDPIDVGEPEDLERA